MSALAPRNCEVTRTDNEVNLAITAPLRVLDSDLGTLDGLLDVQTMKVNLARLGVLKPVSTFPFTWPDNRN